MLKCLLVSKCYVINIAPGNAFSSLTGLFRHQSSHSSQVLHLPVLPTEYTRILKYFLSIIYTVHSSLTMSSKYSNETNIIRELGFTVALLVRRRQRCKNLGGCLADVKRTFVPRNSLKLFSPKNQTVGAPLPTE